MKKYIPSFYGNIKNGKFTLDNPKGFKDYVSTLDGEVLMQVFKKKKKRSNQQNAYYWGVVIKILSDAFGYTDQEMHESLKHMFLVEKVFIPPKVRSTTSLGTYEFAEYINEICRWAARDYAIVIPPPDKGYR